MLGGGWTSLSAASLVEQLAASSKEKVREAMLGLRPKSVIYVMALPPTNNKSVPTATHLELESALGAGEGGGAEGPVM